MANIFEKFDANINTKQLSEDVKNYEVNGGNTEYEEVPAGNYEVKVEKMELRESKNGKPMVSIWFKILAGNFKNSYIFMNQILVEPFQVHIVKDLLKSLDSGIEIDFESYSQFNNLLLDVHEAINEAKLEYQLEYTFDKKGYGKYKIVEVYEG